MIADPMMDSPTNGTGAASSEFSKLHADDDGVSTPTGTGGQQKLGWLRFAFFVFCFTFGGPFGLEAAVREGGPLMALMLLIFIPVLHVTPIVLSTAEMSSWMPSNHGANLWIDRAFGHTVGFINATMNLVTLVIGLSACAVMGVEYLVSAFLPSISFGLQWVLSCGFILIGTIPACVGMEDMGTFSGILAVAILIPFIIGIVVGLPTIEPSTWTPINSGDNIDFGKLFSIGIWLYTGFVSLGAFGGEVKNYTTMIKGCYGCLAVSIPTYLLTLTVALQVSGSWEDGFLGTAFNTILPGLGTAVSVAGAFSGLALYSSSLAGSSRIIWGMADIGWLPKLFTYTHPKTGSPLPAVVIQMFITMIFSAFDFTFLVNLQMVVGTAGYLLYFLAFVTLRYKEPFGHRKFTVPGGKVVAWIMITPIFLVWWILFVTSIMADWRVDVGVIGMVLFVALIYMKFVRGKERKRFDYSHSEVTGTPVGSPQLKATTQFELDPESRELADLH